ncbi:hypothetical protein N9S00_07045 [Luminiphilus sp.]|nr:hypothetical protein [Luminiphilus sp.]
MNNKQILNDAEDLARDIFKRAQHHCRKDGAAVIATAVQAQAIIRLEESLTSLKQLIESLAAKEAARDE